jgi:hypothetical protein
MIVSIHQYELTDETTHEAFRAAIEAAERRGLFDLPGLIEYQFLRGIKGTRRGGYTAVWTYESREAWAELWGPVEDPIPKAEYPASWRTWEEDVLDPLIVGDPDAIDFTTYDVLRTERR